MLCNEQDLVETMLLMFFWNMSLNNELLAYLNEKVYFPVLFSGRTIITAEEVSACLKELKQTEEGLKEWSDSTIDITASKYLTLLKKFGLLDGAIKKKIIYKNLSEKQFVLFLYWLMQAEDTTNLGDSIWMSIPLWRKNILLRGVYSINIPNILMSILMGIF